MRIGVAPGMASRRKSSKASLTLPVQNCFGHYRAGRIARAKDQNIVGFVASGGFSLGGEWV
jgi:hypothetical protein